MPSSPKISIIVPVYGVEKYIEKCLKSIQMQTFTDFECIVVDDGSLDNSIQVGKSAVNGDDRFIFVSKPNGGLASARNFGLDRARGDYIAFIDSDDWVEPDFLKLPYNQLIKSKSDICLFGVNYVDDNNNFLSRILPCKSRIEGNILLIDATILELAACSKLYSKEKISELYFDENTITYEDITFALQALENSKLTLVKEPLYNYLQRPGSLSKDIKPTFLQDRLQIVEFKKEFYLTKTSGSIQDPYYIYSYLSDFIFHAIIKFARYSQSYATDIKKLKSTIDYTLFNLKNILLVMQRNKKIGISLLIFKISPNAFRSLVRFWFRNKTA